MKTTLTLLVAVLVIACSNPQKLIEKDNPHRAYQVSLRKCKSGKAKAKNVEALEASYELLTIEDAEVVNTLVGEEKLSVWPKVYTVAQRIEKRQTQVVQVANRLQREAVYLNLRHYPVEGLLEEAADKSALFFYNEALALVDYARQGDRIAARSAHRFLNSCQKYRHDFKDSEDLKGEMFELGTTYILMNPTLGDIAPEVADDLFATLFRKKSFPTREGWSYFMMEPEGEKKPHFEVNVSFSNIYVSGNNSNTSSCIASKEIEDGYTEKKVWSEPDSAYVTIKEKKYKTVTATVTTTEQSKNAELKMNIEIWDVTNQVIAFQDTWRGFDSWSNEYSSVCGDRRALGNGCNDEGGFCRSYPSGRSMLRDAAAGLRRPFFRRIEKLD